MIRQRGELKFEAHCTLRDGVSYMEKSIWLDCALKALSSGASGEEAVMRADCVIMAFTERANDD